MRAIMVAGLVMTGIIVGVPASVQAAGWASEALTPPAEVEDTRLEAISCSSTSFCVTSGWYLYGGEEKVFVGAPWYSWNGSSWSGANLLEGENPFVQGASCTSSSFCVLAGSWGPGGEELTLAFHWNGTKWSTVSTPSPHLGEQDELSDVSCTSSTACTAVGDGIWGSETNALRWNGETWSTQTTPNPGESVNNLTGVSCTSSTHCVAVGNKGSAEGSETTLAMTWNGTTWSAQTTPNPVGALRASAEDVWCTSSTACTAVGVWEIEAGPLPFAMRWNGTTWSMQQVKLPSETNFGWLDGVSCTSSTFCMGVGSYEKIGKGTFTMAQKWDGTNWMAEKPANLGASFNSLESVSCLASNWCKAAGHYRNKESVLTPFLDHFSG
jgi:hypothetical protein